MIEGQSVRGCAISSVTFGVFHGGGNIFSVSTFQQLHGLPEAGVLFSLSTVGKVG